MLDDATAAFEDFVRGRSTSLFRVALLLAGGNKVEAEDLLQITLERLYRHRGSVFRERTPDAYARRVLVNASVDWRRRLHRRPEQPLEKAGIEPPVRDWSAQVDDRELLVGGLNNLPPRQRAVLVLRYFEDLSDADIAAALSCSVGTVKSQASRGLDKLRRLFELWEDASSTSRMGQESD